ncbi:MAG: hypothetical protein ABJH04_11445 [Cyclobacteriaceae bacterium]
MVDASIEMKAIIFTFSIFMLVGCQSETDRERPTELDFMLGEWAAEAKIKVSPEDYITGVGTINAYYNGDTLMADMNIQFEEFDVVGVTKRLYNFEKEMWEISWNPEEASEVVPNIEGKMRDNRFIELNFGEDQFGSFMGRLVIFDITKDHFSVRKDRLYDTGGLMKDIWVYEATRKPANR